MKKLKKIKQLVLLISILLACISCKEKEPPPKEPDITYYNVVGEGYAFRCDSQGNILYPIKAQIRMVSRITWRLSTLGTSQPEEIFFTDAATGKYQVRFIKEYKGDEPEWYTLHFSDRISDENTFTYFGSFSIMPDKVKNAQNTINLDTFKIYRGSTVVITK